MQLGRVGRWLAVWNVPRQKYSEHFEEDHRPAWYKIGYICGVRLQAWFALEHHLETASRLVLTKRRGHLMWKSQLECW